MQVRDQNNRKPANQAGGPAPQTPRGFTLKGKWQKDRRLQKKQLPVSGLNASSVFHRSGCASAEPYPLKHEIMVAEQINL